MFEMPTNQTEWFQLGAQLVVSGYTAKAVQTVAANHTDLNPDGVPVRTTGLVTGIYVSAKAKPYTDRLVETAVERYSAWKQARQNKQNTK